MCAFHFHTRLFLRYDEVPAILTPVQFSEEVNVAASGSLVFLLI